MFITASLTFASQDVEWPKCPTTDEQMKMRQGHAQEYHLQTQKRNSAKWDNTSEAWGHCAQWISQSEKHLGSTYMRYLKWKSQIPMVSKSRMLVTRDWKQGEREVTDGQQEVSVKWDEQTLGLLYNSQQSWIIIIWCHLQDTWACSLIPMNLFTKQRQT